MDGLTLWSRPGWGSAIVEAQLDWLGIDYGRLDVGDLFADEHARREIEALNPVGQLPVLRLVDGSILTESAAITLHLGDVAPASRSLVPPSGTAERVRFLRWLIFLVVNIYPTFTYGDVPERFVPAESADAFAGAVFRHRERLCRILEEEAGAPWFLGERLTAIDLYLAVMTRWQPRRAWFAAETPALAAIAARADGLPELAGTWQRNFGEDEA